MQFRHGTQQIYMRNPQVEMEGLKCDICKAEDILGTRIYRSGLCGSLVRCPEHDFDCMPDFGREVCRICGTQVTGSRVVHSRGPKGPYYSAFCPKCLRGRSRGNIVHEHGVDCKRA